MPPRCEDRSSDVSDFGHTKSGTAPLTKGVVPSQHVAAAKQRPRAPRKHKGNLRFGVHGWSGVASTALTSAAALVAHHNSEPSCLSSMLSLCAAMTASISASSGVPLIGQAPVRTVISKNVIPPHREAFRRTASSVYYLSARIGWNHLRRYFASFPILLDWAWGGLAVLYAIQFFLPRIQDTEWRNGNTYVFVLPMAGGIMIDAFFQLPVLRCRERNLNNFSAELACWNKDVVIEFDLLCVLLAALVVAFLFTLAFRGTFDIRRCYWGSAMVVHSICIYLVVKALPFIFGSV